jgi:hypothetical protein
MEVVKNRLENFRLLILGAGGVVTEDYLAGKTKNSFLRNLRCVWKAVEILLKK